MNIPLPRRIIFLIIFIIATASFAVAGVIIRGLSADTNVVYWDLQSATMNDCDVTDGCSTSDTGIDFSADGAEARESADRLYLTATDDSNMEYDQGTIEFTFYGYSSGVTAYANLVRWGADYDDFALIRNASDTALQFYIGGDASDFSITDDLWNDGENTVRITWDDTADERKVYINGVLRDTDTGAFTPAAPNGSNFYLCTGPEADVHCEGYISDFKIWHTVEVP